MRHILVFDLDNTICEDTISSRNVPEFLIRLHTHIYPNGSVYVVTARRKVEDGKEASLMDILSYNVDKRIVRALCDYNRGTLMENWLYYNHNDKDIIPIVEYEMKRRGGRAMQYIEETIPQDPNGYEYAKATYYMGVIKMLQLEDIVKKELKRGDDVYIQFFDDSEYNFHAFHVFVKLIKSPLISKHVHFKGGKGRPVFEGAPVISYNPRTGEFGEEVMPAWHK